MQIKNRKHQLNIQTKLRTTLC